MAALDSDTLRCPEPQYQVQNGQDRSLCFQRDDNVVDCRFRHKRSEGDKVNPKGTALPELLHLSSPTLTGQLLGEQRDDGGGGQASTCHQSRDLGLGR